MNVNDFMHFYVQIQRLCTVADWPISLTITGFNTTIKTPVGSIEYYLQGDRTWPPVYAQDCDSIYVATMDCGDPVISLRSHLKLMTCSINELILGGRRIPDIGRYKRYAHNKCNDCKASGVTSNGFICECTYKHCVFLDDFSAEELPEELRCGC